MQYWLMKTEPEEFSFEDLERTGETHWDGVRNYQAKNNLAAMKVGDEALIYHSVGPKEVVGIAKVSKAAYPDPTDKEKKWICVNVKPVKRLKKSVHLEDFKTHKLLSQTPLVKQSRLSVMPLSKAEFEAVLKLGS